MTAEELFMERLGIPPPGSDIEMAKPTASKQTPINENCPIRPGRIADPNITAKNEKGELVAFCCNGCKDQFVSNLPAPEMMKEAEMMEGSEMMASNSSSSMETGYRRRGNPNIVTVTPLEHQKLAILQVVVTSFVNLVVHPRPNTSFSQTSSCRSGSCGHERIC